MKGENEVVQKTRHSRLRAPGGLKFCVIFRQGALFFYPKKILGAQLCTCAVWVAGVAYKQD